MSLRLRVYFTRGALDRRIATGQPFPWSPAIALRAGQLTHPHTRQQLVRNLRGLVAYVDDVGSRFVVSAVVIQCVPVRIGRESILGLAERLEGPAQVCARGVALAQLLLTDGARSPMFSGRTGRTVTDAVWEVADALGADAPPTGLDAVAL